MTVDVWVSRRRENVASKPQALSCDGIQFEE